MSAVILPFKSWVEDRYTRDVRERHAREIRRMADRHEKELTRARLMDTYPREEAHDDGADTLVRPKKVVLTPAQKAEMKRLLKGARSKKARDLIRLDYEYDGQDGKADLIDTEPSYEVSHLSFSEFYKKT